MLHGHYSRFFATTSPSATLSPPFHFPVLPVIGRIAPEISRAGTRRASPVSLMRPCHRAVANTPPKWLAASVSLRRAMLPSSSFERFGLWGDDFSRLLRVHFSLRPDDLLTILKMALSVVERCGFPLPHYPSYEVLTFTSVGLPPTDHISLLSFPGCTEAQSPRPLTPPAYASKHISRCAPQN